MCGVGGTRKKLRPVVDSSLMTMHLSDNAETGSYALLFWWLIGHLVTGASDEVSFSPGIPPPQGDSLWLSGSLQHPSRHATLQSRYFMSSSKYTLNMRLRTIFDGPRTNMSMHRCADWYGAIQGLSLLHLPHHVFMSDHSLICFHYPHPKEIPTDQNTMKSLRRTLTAILVLVASSGSTLTTAVWAEKVVVGYYTAGSALSGLNLAKVPVQSLTHIAYAFAAVAPDGTVTLANPEVATSFDTGSGFPTDTCPTAISGMLSPHP